MLQDHEMGEFHHGGDDVVSISQDPFKSLTFYNNNNSTNISPPIPPHSPYNSQSSLSTSTSSDYSSIFPHNPPPTLPLPPPHTTPDHPPIPDTQLNPIFAEIDAKLVTFLPPPLTTQQYQKIDQKKPTSLQYRPSVNAAYYAHYLSHPNYTKIQSAHIYTAIITIAILISIFCAPLRIGLSYFDHFRSQMIAKLLRHIVDDQNDHQDTTISWVYVSLFVFAIAAIPSIISASIIIYIEPNAIGSGIVNIKGYLNGYDLRGFFTLKLLVFKFLVTFLTAASHVPTGVQSSLIHIGAVIGGYFASNYQRWVSAVCCCRKPYIDVENQRNNVVLYDPDQQEYEKIDEIVKMYPTLINREFREIMREMRANHDNNRTNYDQPRDFDVYSQKDTTEPKIDEYYKSIITTYPIDDITILPQFYGFLDANGEIVEPKYLDPLLFDNPLNTLIPLTSSARRRLAIHYGLVLTELPYALLPPEYITAIKNAQNLPPSDTSMLRQHKIFDRQNTIKSLGSDVNISVITPARSHRGTLNTNISQDDYNRDTLSNTDHSDLDAVNAPSTESEDSDNAMDNRFEQSMVLHKQRRDKSSELFKKRIPYARARNIAEAQRQYKSDIQFRKLLQRSAKSGLLFDPKSHHPKVPFHHTQDNQDTLGNNSSSKTLLVNANGDIENSYIENYENDQTFSTLSSSQPRAHNVRVGRATTVGHDAFEEYFAGEDYTIFTNEIDDQVNIVTTPYSLLTPQCREANGFVCDLYGDEDVTVGGNDCNSTELKSVLPPPLSSITEKNENFRDLPEFYRSNSDRMYTDRHISAYNDEINYFLLKRQKEERTGIEERYKHQSGSDNNYKSGQPHKAKKKTGNKNDNSNNDVVSHIIPTTLQIDDWVGETLLNDFTKETKLINVADIKKYHKRKKTSKKASNIHVHTTKPLVTTLPIHEPSFNRSEHQAELSDHLSQESHFSSNIFFQPSFSSADFAYMADTIPNNITTNSPNETPPDLDFAELYSGLLPPSGQFTPRQVPHISQNIPSPYNEETPAGTPLPEPNLLLPLSTLLYSPVFNSGADVPLSFVSLHSLSPNISISNSASENYEHGDIISTLPYIGSSGHLCFDPNPHNAHHHPHAHHHFKTKRGHPHKSHQLTKYSPDPSPPFKSPETPRPALPGPPNPSSPTISPDAPLSPSQFPYFNSNPPPRRQTCWPPSSINHNIPSLSEPSILRTFVTMGVIGGINVATGSVIGAILFAMEDVISFTNKRFLTEAIITTILVSFVTFTLYTLESPGHYGIFTLFTQARYFVGTHWVDYNAAELSLAFVVGCIVGVVGQIFGMAQRLFAKVRGNYIKVLGGSPWLRIIDSTIIPIIFASFCLYLPAAFTCVPVDPIYAQYSKFTRNRDTFPASLYAFHAYTCPPGTHNELAALTLTSPGTGILRILQRNVPHIFHSSTLLVYLILYMLATVCVSQLTNGAGLVVPTITMGSLCGRLLGVLWYYLFSTNPNSLLIIDNTAPISMTGGIVPNNIFDPGMFAVCGVLALFASVQQSIWFGFVVLEMIGDWAIMQLALMATFGSLCVKYLWLWIINRDIVNTINPHVSALKTTKAAAYIEPMTNNYEELAGAHKYLAFLGTVENLMESDVVMLGVTEQLWYVILLLTYYPHKIYPVAVNPCRCGVIRHARTRINTMMKLDVYPEKNNNIRNASNFDSSNTCTCQYHVDNTYVGGISRITLLVMLNRRVWRDVVYDARQGAIVSESHYHTHGPHASASYDRTQILTYHQYNYLKSRAMMNLHEFQARLLRLTDCQETPRNVVIDNNHILIDTAPADVFPIKQTGGENNANTVSIEMVDLNAKESNTDNLKNKDEQIDDFSAFIDIATIVNRSHVVIPSSTSAITVYQLFSVLQGQMAIVIDNSGNIIGVVTKFELFDEVVHSRYNLVQQKTYEKYKNDIIAELILESPYSHSSISQSNSSDLLYDTEQSSDDNIDILGAQKHKIDDFLAHIEPYQLHRKINEFRAREYINDNTALAQQVQLKRQYYQQRYMSRQINEQNSMNIPHPTAHVNINRNSIPDS